MTFENLTQHHIVFSMRKRLYDRLNVLAVLLGCKDAEDFILFALEGHISKVFQDLRDPTITEGLSAEGLEVRDALLEVICAPRVYVTTPSRSLNTSQIISKKLTGPSDTFLKSLVRRDLDFQELLRLKREEVELLRKKYGRHVSEEIRAKMRKSQQERRKKEKPKKLLLDKDKRLLKNLREKRY